MPKLKIAAPRELDPWETQLPWHAAEHTLRLCEQHLSQDTWDRLLRWNDDATALPECGGAVYVSDMKLQDGHIDYTTHVLHFRGLDGQDMSPLPSDLRDCIAFAASLGFNSIEFESFDEQDCPLTEHIPAYPRAYNPNPKVGTHLKYLPGRRPPRDT